MKKYDGRPHWAKAFDMKNFDIKKLYPLYDAFMVQKEIMDPE